MVNWIELLLMALAFFLMLPAYGLLPYLMVRRLLPLRQARWRRGVLLLGMGTLAAMVIYVGDPVNILGTLPVVLAAVLVGLDGGLLERGTVALIFFTLGTSICGLLDNLPLFENPWVSQLARLASWGLIWLIFRRLCRGVGEIHLSLRLWRLVLAMAAAPFMAMTAGISLSDDTYGAMTPMLVIMPFTLLSAVALLAAIVTLSRQTALERAASLAEMNHRYYGQLEQRQQEVRRLRHDMKNQLETLGALSPEEVGPYLRQLLDSPAMSPDRCYSPNRVLNVILSAKAAAMEPHQIALDWAAPLPEELPFAQTDLCAAVCNGLDNALEACLRLPPERRQIVLRASARKGLFVLQIKNPCAEAPTLSQGRPRTTKADDAAHGFGLLSIQAVAEAYGGTVEYRAQNGQFELLLYLPLSTI